MRLADSPEMVKRGRLLETVRARELESDDSVARLGLSVSLRVKI